MTYSPMAAAFSTRLLFLDDIEAGEGGGHGHVVLAEGVGMDDAAFHGIEDGVHDARGGDDGADGDESAGEGLGAADDVGLDVGPVLEGEPFSGSAEAALDFVGDEEGAEFVAEALGLDKEIVGDDFAAFALDGLDDEGGGFALAELALRGRPDR